MPAPLTPKIKEHATDYILSRRCRGGGFCFYLSGQLRQYAIDVRKLPVEILSIFKRLLCLVDLYRMQEMERDADIEGNIILFILSFQNEDAGFGHLQSSLSETSRALSLLDLLGYPLAELEVERFIRRCETPLSGFTDVPRSSLSYMEYIHAGAKASSLISYRLRHHRQCTDFVLNCQSANGGFSRAPHTGIATMENTFHAIQALKLLSGMEKTL